MLESMMKSSDFKGNMKLTLIQIQMKILMLQLQIQVRLKNFFIWQCFASVRTTYHTVASSRLIYYSILDHYVQRSQNISIKIPLHKQSENLLLTDTVYFLGLYSKCFFIYFSETIDLPLSSQLINGTGKTKGQLISE